MARLIALRDRLIREGKPSPLGHAVLAMLIISGAASLYGLSYFSIQRLSDDWDVCPQTRNPAPVEPSKAGSASSAHEPKATTRQITQASASATPTQPHPLLSEPLQKPLPDLNHVFASIDRLDKKAAASQPSSPVSRDQIERLETQLLQFQRAQQSACRIGVFFFAHRNATLSVATAAAILALGSLALISKEGWKDTNNVIINIGLTSGLILFTTITYSQLYGQGSNFENQKAKVILASNAINSVASAVANRTDASIVKDADRVSDSKARAISLTKAEDMAALINALDRQLEVLVNLDFSGDASFAEQSALRIRDLFKASDKPAPTQP